MKNTPAQIMLLIAVVLTFGVLLGVWLSRVYADLITIGRPQNPKALVIRPKPSYETDVLVIHDIFFQEKPWAWRMLSELESQGHAIVIVQSLAQLDSRLKMYDHVVHSTQKLSDEGVASSNQGLFSFDSELAYKLAKVLKRSVQYVPMELSYSNFTTDGSICLVSDNFSDRMAARKIMTTIMGCEKDYILSELPRVKARDYMQFLSPAVLLIADDLFSLRLDGQKISELAAAKAFLARRVGLKVLPFQNYNGSFLDVIRMGRAVILPEELQRLGVNIPGLDPIPVPDSLAGYVMVL